MSGSMIAAIVAIVGALVLALGNFRGRRLSFERGAAMAVAWIVIIAALAFVLTRLGV